MHISEINIYPIKSLKGIALKSSKIEARGLWLDRRWVLTDARERFLTQREMPKMATIGVAVRGEGVVVSAENITSIAINPLTSGVREMVQVWDSESEALAYEGGVNDWFSQVLGEEVHLYYMPDDAGRPLSPRFDRGGELVSFADGYPLMMLGRASLGELNARIRARLSEGSRAATIPPAEPGTPPKQGGEFEDGVADPPTEELPPRHRSGATPSRQGGELFRDLPMDRFRPNLVVEGSEAFAEDRWQRIRVGEAIFRITKPCVRCIMTTVDQASGEFDGKEPLRTLARFRMAKDIFPNDLSRLGLSPNGVVFGENLVPETPGARINVGDEVEVLECRS